jgi:hypothetical protein
MTAIRFQFEVRVNVPGRARSTFGRVSEIVGSAITLVSPTELVPGEAVELEMADSVLYGEVLSSEPHGSSFQTGIEMRRVAVGATELSRILKRVLLKAVPELPGLGSPEPDLD